MPSTVLFLLLLIAIFSVYGFVNADFFERYLFSVSAIRGHKQYDRFLSAIFLHAGILHLAFNLYAFYVFSSSMEAYYGHLFLLALFFISGVGANLITLFLKRNQPAYTAVGASGAVSGIIFSSIFLFPDISIGIFPLPFMLPGWLFAILYVFISLYAAAKETGNIAHEAHLGGALLGMFVTFAFYPSILLQQPLLSAVLILPIVALLLASYKDPYLLQKWINKIGH